MKSRIACAVLIITGLTENVGQVYKGRKWVPPRMNPDLFPEPEFDLSSPECIPYREPCGFYSFTINGYPPLKWVKSWCRCDKDHICTYERTDMKMRIYRHSCTPKDSKEYD
ncbi:hypothetical protein ACH3XW_12385 [Acanthocheilonema viteae]|uniref:Uncharacterized protein n=1 Tax=Acanthocheilonema viteae TaxID=6277 RepID=A0A498SH45_ACAVI|nr:unnamed protein product [Acanthocheilonema viteae]